MESLKIFTQVIMKNKFVRGTQISMNFRRNDWKSIDDNNDYGKRLVFV
jgi:hypothetical protein